MARIKLGALVTDIAGSIGGTCFSKNAYGLSARNRAISSAKESSQQENVRKNLLTAQNFWRLMSDGQRAQYDRYSQFRPQYSHGNKTSLLSGYNLFLKHSLIKLAAGSLPLTDVDFVAPPLNILPPIVTRSGLGLFYDINVTIALEPFVILSKFSRPYDRSKFIPNSNLRVVLPQSISGSDVFITSNYLEKFGVLPDVDQWLLCEFTVVSSTAPLIYPVWRGLVKVTS